MHSYHITLKPQSAFATPMKGDTLFGQLCWAIRNRYGEESLTSLLNGYPQGQPFAVVSDAFPAGYLPLPTLPGHYYHKPEQQERKALKKKTWLPVGAVSAPLTDWQALAVTGKHIAEQCAAQLSRGKKTACSHWHFVESHLQPHNAINRQSHTTGTGFAPYSIEQDWFVEGLHWDVYILLDHRWSEQKLRQCLEDIGVMGYGKDASIGLGKFSLETITAKPLPSQANTNACLTLAPCAPQNQGYESTLSFYQLFTRFGRHGDIAVHQTGQPFKNPVLLAQTAAVFGVAPPKSGFIGQGLGGSGQLSKTVAETVQQGYAPVIGIQLDLNEIDEQ